MKLLYRIAHNALAAEEVTHTIEINELLRVGLLFLQSTALQP